MPGLEPSSCIRGIPIAALLLLSACNDLFPWHEPEVRTFVSDRLSQCPDADTLCTLLIPLAADSELLAKLDGNSTAGKSQLAQATGMRWSEPRVQHHSMHIDFPQSPKGRTRSIYVVEVLRAETSHDSLLSIASNGGTVVWLNGNLLGASRVAGRGVRQHQDIYYASLRQGANILLYRVHDNGEESQLHREWHPQTSLPDLLSASINLGAFSTLVPTPILQDTATTVPLWPPQVHVRGDVIVHFRWTTLLGDSLADAGKHSDMYPEALPLPQRFNGLAVLQTQVLDAATGKRLYFEECPIFADSTAQRLARDLTTGHDTADPVRTARLDAVRAHFNLDPVRRISAPDNWLKAQALASLYRHIRDPQGFHLYPGPQVWGYRASNGSVQPYWLTVPGPADEPGQPRQPALLFSVTHHFNSDYWNGRGRVGGFLIHLGIMSSRYGTYGVLPHLGGVQDFDSIAVEELPAITRQVDSVFRIDTAAVGILAWSSHAREVVEMALDPRVSIAWLGMAVPRMYRDERQLAEALDSLHRIRPQLHWLVWQASNDTVVLREDTEKWVKEVRERGFDTRYRVVPYSTHLGGYFEDVEADLHRNVAFRFRGEGGRALRESLSARGATNPP